MKRIGLVMLSLLIPFSVCAQSSSAVHILVTDKLGREIKEFVTVSLSRVGSPGSRIESATQDMPDVPYGTYELEVKVPGFSTLRKRVQINHQEQWISAALELAPIEAPRVKGLDLTGRVGPPDRRRDRVSVKLMHLFLDVERKVRVQRDGTFKAAGLPVGTYVIATMRGWDICDIRRHELGYGRTTVNISLDPNACTR